jgi:ATP-dependent DNA helicase RecQ
VRAAGQVRAGEARLLYIAPETLLRPETLILLDNCRVECLTIDEAHCISEWGHDFRPEYRQLAGVRRRLPNAVCLAVTATATGRVRQDIKQSLAINDADEFVASFNRENLYLAARSKRHGFEQISHFLAERRDQSGIIYCQTRKQVDALAERLAAAGWSALPYHAGLDDETRRRNQRRFSHDQTQIIVATIAFGMGINKSNVRFIIHYGLPKSLEHYYQEIGRAGRDGLPADCLLLYSRADRMTQARFLSEMEAALRPAARARLEAMVHYAASGGCRRRPLLAYFGESYLADNCQMCDNCLATVGAAPEEPEPAAGEPVDLTIPAQKFLSCIKRTGELYGADYIIDVLRGSRGRRLTARGHDRLSTYNIGRDLSRDAWQALSDLLLRDGALDRDPNFGGLKLTPAGYAILKGQPFWGAIARARERRAPQAIAYDEALFDRLRARRRELAEAAGLPPYVIFSDRSLVDMASAYPQSRAAFATIFGVGQRKLDQYADTFLAIITDYCQERRIAEVRREGRRQLVVSSPPPTGSRTRELVSLYNSGCSLRQLAARQGVTVKTIVAHLCRAAEAGATLRPDGILDELSASPEQQARALELFNELGTYRLRPIFEALDEQLSYDDLQLLRLYVISGESGKEGAPASGDLEKAAKK